MAMVKGRALEERREMKRANQRNFRINNPDAQLQIELRRYGVTVNWYRAREQAQHGLCAICGQPETAKRNGKVKRLSVDHDHCTGQARGLICQACNCKLAVIEDVDWYSKATAYLGAVYHEMFTTSVQDNSSDGSTR
jgi:hypothetical protein